MSRKRKRGCRKRIRYTARKEEVKREEFKVKILDSVNVNKKGVQDWRKENAEFERSDLGSNKRSTWTARKAEKSGVGEKIKIHQGERGNKQKEKNKQRG